MKRQASPLIGKLIELKVQLDAMKPLYQQYDMALERALKMRKIPAQVDHKGHTWIISVVDTFQEKNTAWKSVAQRRFDVTVSRKTPKELTSLDIFKVRKRTS